ncbi:MAG TPA: hypothetical protein ENI82_01495 [Bacteroidetes bacterium]|nr:hypothetical protein [Bacteroidota bacterium]
MGFTEYSKTNEQNLKLRNFYRRYFVWGSKEKPGIDLEKRRPAVENSPEFKKHIKQAKTKRKRNVILTLLVFLVLVIIVAIFVVSI